MAASSSVSGQKRRAFRSVQEAREKLTYKSSGGLEFDYELLMMFVKNELSAAITTPLLAVVVAVGAMFWSPVDELLLWLCCIFVTKGILVGICKQFAKQPRDEVNVATWRAKITAAEFLYGVTWASVVFISPLTEGVAGYTFIFAAVLVVISMRMLFASTVMPIVYAGTLPMTAAIVIRFALLNDPFYWAMAAMAVAVHLYFIWLMNGFNSTVVSMLEFRAEKDALIGELEQSKAISDEARLRAEEANLAKSRFLATMSHELRTPLNAILGFSEIMRDEAFGPHANPTYKEYANDIHESGQHLLTLIDEILDISRIEAGRYELNETPVSLTEIAEECHRLMRVRADNKGLKITQPRGGLAESVGGRTGLAAGLPQPPLQCHQVHAIERDRHAQGRADEGRRPGAQRQGHGAGHSRRRDPPRLAEFRSGLARAPDRRGRNRARSAHHQGLDRAAWRQFRAQEQAALRHRSDGHPAAEPHHGGAAEAHRTRRTRTRRGRTARRPQARELGPAGPRPTLRRLPCVFPQTT
nr:histidine kinase dimerization/phospho-acceptor domain-containing protein [Methyloceanibacter methanicus]